MPPTAHSRTDCENCSGHIEYPPELAGQSIECPHCQQSTALPLQLTPPPPEPRKFYPTPPVAAPPPLIRPTVPLRIRAQSSKVGKICETCGSVGSPVEHTKGSFSIELVLWLLLCVPGIIYSVWRLASREKVCGQCEGKMISIGSPRGQQLWSTYHR